MESSRSWEFKRKAAASFSEIFHGARRGHLRFTWSILAAYLGVSILHAAFDSFGGIAGYIVISIIGLVPLIWLWRRGDRTGWVRLREREPQPQPVAQP